MNTNRARCYVEFCCNTAVHDIVRVDRSSPEVLRQLGRTSRGPIAWGYCGQHAPARRTGGTVAFPADCGGE